MQKHMNGNFDNKTGLFVSVRNGDLNKAIKVLANKIMKERLMADVKKQEYHKTDSQKRKEKHILEMKRRRKSKNRRNED